MLASADMFSGLDLPGFSSETPSSAPSAEPSQAPHFAATEDVLEARTAR